MKINIIIGLLFFFLFGSCHKSEISIEVNSESSIVLKAAPPQVGQLLSKEAYEQYAVQTFSLMNNVIQYADSIGTFPHFLKWDENIWKSIVSQYLVQNHFNEYNLLWDSFINNLNAWQNGNVQATMADWQINLLTDITLLLEELPEDNFFAESRVLIDGVFNDVYGIEGVAWEEKDQTLSSLMIMKGVITLIANNPETNRAPNWKRIGKCVAGVVGGDLAGSLSGVAAGAGLVAATALTGGGAVVVIAGAALVGSFSGKLLGSVYGGCWD